MRYIISDIHGCYEEYKALLEKINFSDKDELYVLGDAMDRGPEPIKVIQDLMSRPNVTYIIGNHDYIMLRLMKRLMVEITEENWESHLTEEDLIDYSFWMNDGGDVTVRQFRILSEWDRMDILDYLEEASVYEVLEHEDNRYVLVHAGIFDFEEGKDLGKYFFTSFIFHRADYSRRYFVDGRTYLVTGHTPTVHIREDKQPLVYEGNGHIALDCGCVFGGKLAAYCVETGEVTYVDG